MELKKQIAAAGGVLVKEYVDDGYSGAQLDRPELGSEGLHRRCSAAGRRRADRMNEPLRVSAGSKCEELTVSISLPVCPA